MHVIRDRNTKKTLYIDHSSMERAVTGDVIVDWYDDKDMELGWSDKKYIPAYYDIDSKGEIIELSLDEAAGRGLYQLSSEQKIVKGKIVDKEKDELIKEGLLDIDELKKSMLSNLSQAALVLRNKLIPDYKLNNAILGLYDDKRKADYRATIEAFRAEYHRLEEMVNKAKSYKQLTELEPRFPDHIIEAAEH